MSYESCGMSEKKERIRTVLCISQGHWMQKRKQCAKNNENGAHFRYLSTEHINNININDTRVEQEMSSECKALSYTHKQPQNSTTTPLQLKTLHLKLVFIGKILKAKVLTKNIPSD